MKPGVYDHLDVEITYDITYRSNVITLPELTQYGFSVATLVEEEIEIKAPIQAVGEPEPTGWFDIIIVDRDLRKFRLAMPRSRTRLPGVEGNWDLEVWELPIEEDSFSQRLTHGWVTRSVGVE